MNQTDRVISMDPLTLQLSCEVDETGQYASGSLRAYRLWQASRRTGGVVEGGEWSAEVYRAEGRSRVVARVTYRAHLEAYLTTVEMLAAGPLGAARRPERPAAPGSARPAKGAQPEGSTKAEWARDVRVFERVRDARAAQILGAAR
jgi:hypothetical protein